MGWAPPAANLAEGAPEQHRDGLEKWYGYGQDSVVQVETLVDYS